MVSSAYIFRPYSCRTLELVRTMMDVYGKYSVCLRLYLVFPLHNGFSLSPSLITIEYQFTCCNNAAGTTIRVVRHASSRSGMFIVIVAIICTVFPKTRSDYDTYMLLSGATYRGPSHLYEIHQTSHGDDDVE
jgi:hypothetical protein